MREDSETLNKTGVDMEKIRTHEDLQILDRNRIVGIAGANGLRERPATFCLNVMLGSNAVFSQKRFTRKGGGCS